MLWDEKGRYDRAEVDRIKFETDPRTWTALYQGRPTPEEGAYFKAEWFRTYAAMPDVSRMRIYGASDYAVTESGGDYTVHLVVGMDSSGNLWVLDLYRKQASPDDWVEGLLDLWERWSPVGWGEEAGQIIKGVGAYLARRMNERRVYCARQQYTSAADKPTRCRDFQAFVSAGRVMFPESAPWWADMRAEMLGFPTGKHDDIIDTMG